MPTGTGKSTTAKQRREWLKNSIRAHLLPLLINQGFKVAPPLLLSPPADRVYVLSFPSWGRLIRTRESGVDLIEIQFATYQRAAFRLNAGVVPTDGLQIASRGPLPSEGIAVHWLDEWFETHARPWLRPMLKAMGLEPLGAWFSVWHWPYQSPRPEDYEKLVLRAASVMPELELALREGRLGRHVRRVVLPSRDRRHLRTVNTTSLA
jgi:hypothetical protein